MNNLANMEKVVELKSSDITLRIVVSDITRIDFFVKIGEFNKFKQIEENEFKSYVHKYFPQMQIGIMPTRFNSFADNLNVLRIDKEKIWKSFEG